jgi:uncharacterized membrane protein
MTGVYIVLILAALAGICVFIIRHQAKRIKDYKAENESLRRENREAVLRIEHLRHYMAKNKIVTEEAEREKRGLEKTPDAGLADRANSLFGGVRKPAGGAPGNGGT